MYINDFLYARVKLIRKEIKSSKIFFIFAVDIKYNKIQKPNRSTTDAKCLRVFINRIKPVVGNGKQPFGIHSFLD